jgi:uncharacterized protein
VANVSTTTESAAVVRRFSDLLRSGKLHEASEVMSEDVAIRHTPALPYGGEYRGRDGFTELVNKMMGMVTPTRLTETEWLAVGDIMTARTTVRFTSIASGEAAETRVVEISTVRDGHIVELDVYYKDPRAVSAILT